MRLSKMGLLIALAQAPVWALAEDDSPAADAAQVAQLAGGEAAEGRIFVIQTEDGEKRVAAGEDEDEENELIIIVGDGAGPSKYWVGLDCTPAEDALRTQLGLSEEIGLVIRTVVKDSPAEAAGLKVHDVITQATLGDTERKLAEVAQLAELIQLAEGRPITLKLRRGGNQVTTVVRPAERPGLTLVAGERGERREIRQPRELNPRRGREGGERSERPGRGGPPAGGPGRFVPPKDGSGRGPGQGGFSFRMMGPLVVDQLSKLPDDMKITITKTGNQPAEISISQGEKSWSVKDSELAKLPPEVRGSLLKFLGAGLMSKLRGSSGGVFPPFRGAFGPGMRGGPQGRPGEHARTDSSRGRGRFQAQHGQPSRESHAAHTGSPHWSAMRKGMASHRGHDGRRHQHGWKGRGGSHGWMAIHSQHGPHFGQHRGCPHCGGSAWDMAHRGHGRGHGGMHGHGHSHCPMCQAQHHAHHPGAMHGHDHGSIGQAHQHPHGPQHAVGGPHPGAGGPPHASADARLEALLTRLEQIVSRQPMTGQMIGRPGAGGFALPQAGGQPNPGQPGAPARAWIEMKRPQPGTNPTTGGEAQPDKEMRARMEAQLNMLRERRAQSGDAEDIRAQLHRMQEQQEKMARAIKELSEAVERIQRK